MKRLSIVLLVLLALVAVPVVASAQTPVSVTQMALANTAQFQGRCAYILATVAMTVRAESAGTANHAERDALARYIIADPQGYAAKVAVVIAGTTNVVAAGTSTVDGVLVSNATDAALLAQITDIWNVLAGV